jgi:GNAT superfamily N-acetyltransferase
MTDPHPDCGCGCGGAGTCGTKALDRAALKARAQELVKHHATGKLVSKRSKSGDPRCSAAASAFARRKAGPADYATLARCRAMARGHKLAASEHRAKQGQTTQERTARAKEMVAKRKGGTPAAAKPPGDDLHFSGMDARTKVAANAAPMKPAPKPKAAGKPRAGAKAPAAPANVAGHEKSAWEAYHKVSKGESNVRVQLADLRKEMAHVPRHEQDKALLALSDKGHASMWRNDDPRTVTAAHKEAALRTPSGEDRHLVYMGGESSGTQTPSPKAAAAAPAPAPPAEARLGPKVATQKGITRAEADRHAREYFGEGHSADSFARAVGAGPRDKVTIGRTQRGELAAVVEGKHHRAVRFFQKDAAGQRVIRNEEIVVKPGMQGRGVASALLERQKRQAAALGVAELHATAARSSKYGGYYALPRMGYDAPIEASVRAKLPKAMKKAKNVSDLMASAEGRAWWKEHGHGIGLAKIRLAKADAAKRTAPRTK